MANLEFSVPYNNDPATLEELFRLKQVGDNRITDVYLNGPQEFAGSGRITEEMTLERFLELVDQIHAAGLRVNLVLNATCEGTGWYTGERLKAHLEFLRLVHREHGVEAVTIANPLYITQTRQRFPDLEICASVMGEIDCVQRAVIYCGAGADVITPDPNINRDLDTLMAIKQATGVRLRLMVNEGCLYKCPFRKFHFNYMSHKSKELGKVEGDYFFASCSQVTCADLSQILKSSWIRPEDMRKYSEITDYFKIVGRARPKSFVLRATRAYMEESWDGNVLDIISSSMNQFALERGAYVDNKCLDQHAFFQNVTCNDPGFDRFKYIESLAKRVIKLKVLTRGILEDLGMKPMADELEAQGKLPVFADRMPF